MSVKYLTVEQLTTWQLRYLGLCDYIASKWSRDPSSKFGSILTNEYDRIISTGVNGFAQGYSDLPERWENREFKYRHVLHAEENAILMAGKDLKSSTLYVNGVPCSSCMSRIAQVKIPLVFCWEPSKDYLSRWSIDEPLQVAEECSILVNIVSR